jgi:tetratricopeptide (TPR) repeat protein
MKSLLLIVASCCFVANLASAQTTKPTTPATKPPASTTTKPAAKPPVPQTPPANAALINHYLMKYATAARWRDTNVARAALYDLIIENPVDSLIFTLAYSYYEDENYFSAALVAQDYLNRNPKDVSFLELAASSYEQIGATERAQQAYETIYLSTNRTSALYKVAFLQFQMKKYVECMTNIDILMTAPDLDKNTASFDDAEKKAKNYPIRVPLLNLKGLITQETDKVAAKKIFEEALTLAPDFLPAKQNLENLK